MQLGLLLNLHRLKRCQLGLKGGGNVPGEVAKMETYPYLSPIHETVRCSLAPKAQEQANLIGSIQREDYGTCSIRDPLSR